MLLRIIHAALTREETRRRRLGAVGRADDARCFYTVHLML